jgi:hypothetical protein
MAYRIEYSHVHRRVYVDYYIKDGLTFRFVDVDLLVQQASFKDYINVIQEYRLKGTAKLERTDSRIISWIK